MDCTFPWNCATCFSIDRKYGFLKTEPQSHEDCGDSKNIERILSIPLQRTHINVYGCFFHFL